VEDTLFTEILERLFEKWSRTPRPSILGAEDDEMGLLHTLLHARGTLPWRPFWFFKQSLSRHSGT
jgi:hypothetical protein